MVNTINVDIDLNHLIKHFSVYALHKMNDLIRIYRTSWVKEWFYDDSKVIYYSTIFIRDFLSSSPFVHIGSIYIMICQIYLLYTVHSTVPFTSKDYSTIHMTACQLLSKSLLQYPHCHSSIGYYGSSQSVINRSIAIASNHNS